MSVTSLLKIKINDSDVEVIIQFAADFFKVSVVFFLTKLYAAICKLHIYELDVIADVLGKY